MKKFCSNCGNELAEGADVCVKCGKMVGSSPVQTGSKNKVAAALLAIFLGVYGAHNFYLGHTSKAVTQLVLTLVGMFTWIFIIGIFFLMATVIWAFIEFIMILTGSIKDSDGNALV